MPGPTRSVTLDVEDVEGASVGTVEDVDLSVLAHRLPVELAASAKDALGVEEGSIELPAQLIQQRTSEALTLSRTLEGLSELVDDA